jgi:hypothetical protein
MLKVEGLYDQEKAGGMTNSLEDWVSRPLEGWATSSIVGWMANSLEG